MRITIKHPAALLTFYILLLWWDASGLLRMGLAASLLHEGGHLLAWGLLCRRPPRLVLSAGGIGLDVRRTQLTAGREAVLAAAGPAVNLLLCGGILAAMQLRASYNGYFFAGANLLVAAFNLLPFGQLDGKTLLRLALG